jgi:hypothetical protein
MPDNGWSRRFFDPIPLPDGGELHTLRDAGHYIANLPKREACVQALNFCIIENGADRTYLRLRLRSHLNAPIAPAVLSFQSAIIVCVRTSMRWLMKHRLFALAIAFLAWGTVTSSLAASEKKFEVKSVAEKKISQLPPGSLFWRIENFPALAQAQAAAGPTGLAAEVYGRAWLFTLGPKGGSSPGGSKVAEIGPVPSISAPEYLLRINSSGGPPGAITRVHTHPGSETFYVLTGELSQRSPHGVSHVGAGQSMPGHGPGMPMQVSSTGTNDLQALVMFVMDATKPFSSPATMP